MSVLSDEQKKFYKDCVLDYHETAKDKGQADKGLILIPELIPIGDKTVLAFLKDAFFAMEYGNDPRTYYYVIMSMSLQAGMVFADKWHSDSSALESGYVDRIIADGPATPCRPLLQSLGLSDNHAENAFYNAIYARWMKKHEPYWKIQDPRTYTFLATLAAFQLGVSMILCEYGYK